MLLYMSVYSYTKQHLNHKIYLLFNNAKITKPSMDVFYHRRLCFIYHMNMKTIKNILTYFSSLNSKCAYYF